MFVCLDFGINSILYQRGIYPPEDFQLVKKYGLTVMVSVDDEVKDYIRRIMSQLHRWIYGGVVSKLVVAVTSTGTGETVERWQFDVEILPQDKSDSDEGGLGSGSKAVEANEESQTVGDDQHPLGQSKSYIDIQKEIQSIIRQITASVTFLPELQGAHSFNVLVYTDQNAKVPYEWKDAEDAKNVQGSNVEQVQFRSFSTDKHKVDAVVSYKLP